MTYVPSFPWGILSMIVLIKTEEVFRVVDQDHDLEENLSDGYLRIVSQDILGHVIPHSLLILQTPHPNQIQLQYYVVKSRNFGSPKLG